LSVEQSDLEFPRCGGAAAAGAGAKRVEQLREALANGLSTTSTADFVQ